MREVTERFCAAAETNDWCAAVDDDGSWSARSLLAEAHILAGQLAEICPRSTVLVQAENSRRLVVAGLAVGLVDGTLALASAHLASDDFADVLDAVRPDAVFGSCSQLDSWATGDVVVGDADVAGWQVRSLTDHSDRDRWQGGVLIGMTSGSTGRAKGVVHRESALRYAAEQEIAAAGLEPGDAIGIIVPVSAAPAFAFGIYMSLLLQSPALLSAVWSPAAALDHLAVHHARWLMCVPTQVLQLSTEAARSRSGALAGLRAITVGGGPMEFATLAEAERNLGVRLLRVFGMSECLGHTTPRLDDSVEIRLARDGRPFPGTDLRIVDDAGAPVPDETPGRGYVKGPSLFLGYALAGRLDPPQLTLDGFLETGDLVVRHADGTINVTGRTKDVVIRGGRNIAIVEVEQALREVPGLDDACVVSVPDAVLGERVAALVVGSGDLTLESVLAGLAENGVAKIKWPEYVVQVQELPLTHVGKVSRVIARDIALREISVRRALAPDAASYRGSTKP